jgi:hypothetical protein
LILETRNPLPSNLFLSCEVVASNLVDMGPPNNRKCVSLLPSPSKSKQSATATATSAAKKSVPSSKKAATKPLSSLGFSSSKHPAVQIGTKVLLDDSIYHGKCPHEVQEHLFVYEVVGVHENGKFVKVQYNNQVVCNGGDKYRVYKEGDEVQVSD